MIDFKIVPSKTGNFIDLTPQEYKAFSNLDAWEQLAPITAASCYAMFLQGYSTEQIAKQNDGLGLHAHGLIVKARLDLDWDKTREEYTRDLMIAVGQSVIKTSLEGIQFATDGMTVFHRTLGKKFTTFLQTGNPEDLGEYNYMSLKSYRDFVDIFEQLMKMEGTKGEKPKTPQPQTESITAGTLERVPEISVDQPISSEAAEAMLSHLLKQEKKK